MFTEIIDTKRLGYIDEQTTLKICKMSMSRYNQDQEGFIPEYGEFFKNLIFKMFGHPKVIYFDQMLKKFEEGTSEEKFLIALFCCTDLIQ